MLILDGDSSIDLSCRIGESLAQLSLLGTALSKLIYEILRY